MPSKFDGNLKLLWNFLFQVKTYAEVVGISAKSEWVKLAITLLSEKSLTWWISASHEYWATLVRCDWTTFEVKIGE